MRCATPPGARQHLLPVEIDGGEISSSVFPRSARVALRHVPADSPATFRPHKIPISNRSRLHLAVTATLGGDSQAERRAAPSTAGFPTTARLASGGRAGQMVSHLPSTNVPVRWR